MHPRTHRTPRTPGTPRGRRARRAVIASCLVSSVALGGAVLLTGPATAAVPGASCTVTPSANGTSVTITGEGFTAPRNLNDGETTEPLNIDANGNFKVTRFQKNVDYTVLAVEEDQPFVFVNCKRVGSQQPDQNQQPPQNRRGDYRQGYRDGFAAGKAFARQECATEAQPDKSRPHSDAYWNGWKQGAHRAFVTSCTD
ncbi:hypothetical protein [Streptomyces sp. WAC06614]|uniref:hypothetical protein n=1 Tax=Streptomyces sp. WAC06614 TaxID=2487416 RepID=UPI000F77AAA3|nr:hypothetical protein [Streptomyces sp. WAC06614]RSS79554.1 hypothetical protein EF918_16980 [Streptomyces sp. WAC06614]